MTLPADLLDELHILTLYNLANGQEGIKIHHTAQDSFIQAVARLHAKGLTSQPDGGYLTPLGFQAADHAQALLSILTRA